MFAEMMRFEKDFGSVLLIKATASAGLDLCDRLDRGDRDVLSGRDIGKVGLAQRPQDGDGGGSVCVTSRYITNCGAVARRL